MAPSTFFLSARGRGAAAGCGAALLLLLGGCAASAPGMERTDYYYARRDRPPAAAAVVRAAPPAPAPVAVPAPPVADSGPAGVPPVVYFDFDRASVRAQDQAVLRAHADYLRRTPGRSVALEGHTDEQGGRAYNLALGQKRADTVRAALVAQGLEGSRAEAVSFGMEVPASPDTSEAGRQRNRRVEFRYR